MFRISTIQRHANRRDPQRRRARLLDRVLPARRRARGSRTLFETVEALKPLEPDFVSVTYGAGGATRDGTVEIATRIKRRARPRGDGAPELRRRDARGPDRDPRSLREAGIENVLALRGDPPRGRGRLPGAGWRAVQRRRARRVHRERYDFALGGACFPEVHPEAPNLEADLAYLKTKVEAGRELPDHPALLRQPRLLRLRRRRPRGRDRRADHPRGDPDRQLRAGGADLRPLRRVDPGRALEPRWRRSAATRRPRPCSGSPTRRASARSSSRAARPGIHFYALNRAPGTRAVLSALRASRPWERAGRRRPPQTLRR